MPGDARRPDRARPTRGPAGRARTPRPPRPAWRSCSPPSARSARTAGWTTGRRCGPTACRSSTAGRRPTTTSSPAAGRGRPPAGRVLRLQPARRGGLRRPADPTSRRPAWSTAPASARSSSRGSSPARRHEAEARAAARLPAVATRSRRTCRSTMFVFPVVEGTPLPDVFERVRGGARATRSSWTPPRSPRDRDALDRGVDRDGPAVTRRPPSVVAGRGCCWRRRWRSSRVFFA